MHHGLRNWPRRRGFALVPGCHDGAAADRFEHDDDHPGKGPHVQLGPRPFYLVDKMDPSETQENLQKCTDHAFFAQTDDFSIGHRGGGTLQFPEHTKESHEAGARMGAGILECDVTFTSDRQLVCRHDQCDLHTTTNILVTDLAASARWPFSQAVFDASGKRTKAASALCCTSDLTLAEFKSLKGKMDAFNPNATDSGRSSRVAPRTGGRICMPPAERS